MTPNQSAFLSLIAHSEIGDALLSESDNGFDVLVGSRPGQPNLFTSYADHPRKLVLVRPGLWSTAAGRYQILAHYFDVYKQQLNLPDFGHDSQDAIALQMIGECHALDDIEAGNIETAVTKCQSRWASFPGANYPGQHMNQMADLISAYQSAGGAVA